MAFSGANKGVLASVRRSDVVNASYDAVTRAYRLGERRADARNFFVRPSAIVAGTTNVATPHDVGFRFGEPAPGAAPASSASVPFSRGSVVTLRYDAAAKVWRVSQNGHALAGVGATNVLIQAVSTSASGYADVTGAITPYSHTVGSGPAALLRGGTVTKGTWSRATPGEGTVWTTADGSPMTLAPGQTWVLLQPVTERSTFG